MSYMRRLHDLLTDNRPSALTQWRELAEDLIVALAKANDTTAEYMGALRVSEQQLVAEVVKRHKLEDQVGWLEERCDQLRADLAEANE